MRKYLIMAVAALTVVAFAAVSYAQDGETTLNVKVKPKDAGTKKKPKSEKVALKVVNGQTSRTMSDLDIYLPKKLKLSLKGMPSCAPDVIAAKGCDEKTELGHGSAMAKAGVNSPDPTLIRDLPFVVTAYKTTSVVTGKTMLGFYLDGPKVEDRDFDFLAETGLRKASGKYGQRLHIDVPQAAQSTGGSSFNGLVSFEIKDLGKKKGNKKLIASTGCKNRKHPFKVVMTFIANGVSEAGTVERKDNAACKK